MPTKISPKMAVPPSVLANISKNKFTEVTDKDQILALLQDRTIVSSDRFLLPKGDYKIVDISAAKWQNEGQREAVMVLLHTEDGKVTTLGALRRIDSKMEHYGPATESVCEKDLLEAIQERGLTVLSVETTTQTVFKNGVRVPIDGKEGEYQTRPMKIMKWKYTK